ncbi:MAG: hypothetical protein SCARUB_00769 [Candidatus Scalindua rubra]|uniref:Uncharacterized protein n=1 Tax=Candidatus Scalindua rubra TaxID=1872076 RepID=A0A1E3XEN7_9BACT|nr:MAG: hypothetical protein SCARUB_00769 [Candidatus Scalindua rubra]
MSILLVATIWWILSSQPIDASADSEYLSDLERPSVDIVRQMNYIQRMSNNQSHNSPSLNGEGTENGSGAEVKLVNISNEMSVERINALRKYIASKTVGICDFTCHKCYRCSLVYGESESGSTENLFLDE